MSLNFWHEPQHLEIKQFRSGSRMDVREDAKGKGVRLWCTNTCSAWALQLRGRMTSTLFVIATASLSRADMEALRDAITAELDAADKLLTSDA